MKEIKSHIIFSGSSNYSLAKEIANNLNKDLGKIDIKKFPDGETGVHILENVRGKKVFIVQSIANNPNHYLMELLIIVDALKRASAKEIVAVIPYFGYARQDRREKERVPITAKLVADLLEKSGVTHILTMDLHTDQIQGFFNIPVDNLGARLVMTNEIKKLILHNPCVVSPDIGSSKLARRFAEDLDFDIAVVDKRRINSEKVEDIALIGTVKDKDIVIVDDICSTGKTLIEASKLCKKAGAKKIFAAVTHGPLALKSFENCPIEKIFFTNSIEYKGKEDKFYFISISGVLAKAIGCVFNDNSMSSLLS
jgi:ribose-phosphate pyrophosphokinase